MKRVSTGIDDLNAKLGGGYPMGKAILVTGTAGSGKTIFGLHLLQRSCMDGMKCMMVATEETPEDILLQADMLGLDLGGYYNSGQLTIERVLESRSKIAEQAAKLGFTQDGLGIDLILLADLVPDCTDIVVIDDVGVFTLSMTVQDFRDQFDALNYTLNRKGCTTIFVMDESAYDMTNRIADYSVYGSVRLLVKENPYTEKIERYISIPKMRSTKLSLELSLFDITSDGIKLRKPGSKTE